MNNLRQIGIFSEGYAQDREGIYPPATLESYYPWLPVKWHRGRGFDIHGDAGHGAHWHGWLYFLEEYITSGQKNAWGEEIVAGKGNILTCPSHWYRPWIESTKGGFNNDWAIWASYGMNVAVLGPHPGGNGYEPGWPGWNVGVPGFIDSHRLVDALNHASTTIHIAEHAGTKPDGTLVRGDGYESSNEWVNPPNVSWPMTGPGAYFEIPDGYASADPLGLSGRQRHNGQTLRVSHGSKSNYLFYDGHVESLKPWDTCGPTLDDGPANAMWNGRHPRSP